MSSTAKPSRIIKLTAENVKRLKAVSLSPSGSVVRIGGRNSQGKTSLMDSITYALCGAGAVPEEPVRRGEKSAQIILETDELVITRRFTAAGGTSLTVTNKDGLRYNGPQGVLDKLTATLAFDPLSFCRADKKSQFKQLQTLLGIDTAAIDKERKEGFDRRTSKNREVASLKAVVDSLPIAGPARVEIRDLLTELSEAERQNAAAADLEREAMEAESILINRRSDLRQVDQQIMELDLQLTRLRELRDEKREAVEISARQTDAASDRAQAAVRIPIEPIRQRIAAVEETNQAAAQAELRRTKLKELEALEDESRMMTEHLQELDRRRAAMLSDCPMPVPGIGFEAEGVTLNGLPLEQASASEQLRLGVAVACAANPHLRVMLVRDGSLLDDDSMRLLEEMAEAHQAQIWVERVGDDGTCAVVIEDGEAAEPEGPAPVPAVIPAPKPAPVAAAAPEPAECLY